MAEMHEVPQLNIPSPPIKATAIRRYATLVAIALLGRWRPQYSSVLMLTSRICVRRGPHENLATAAAMQFISENTSIPVPKVYCAFVRKGITYIVMSRIAGSMIGHGWVYRSEESRNKLLAQLKSYIDEMRSLPPKREGLVGSVDGGTLLDGRLHTHVKRFGPFGSVNEFHEFLRHRAEAHPDYPSEINEMIRKQSEMETCGTRFTHGDLSCFNILARGDEIVGIVDWETAGWYPAYWEYTTAINLYIPSTEFWRDEVHKFISEYPDALQMEKVRNKYFGMFSQPPESSSIKDGSRIGS